MPDARTIIDGDPGSRWTNDTSKVWYQLTCAMINTCGLCLQYHLKIARYWPLPLHHSCRCWLTVIKVGAESDPFADFRAILEGMAMPEKVAAIGRSNWALLRSGVVTWEQIVTPARVRSFREVMDLNRISIKAAIKAGVQPSIARTAYSATPSPEHVHAAQHWQSLIDRVLKSATLHEATLGLLGERMLSRTRPTPAGVVLPGIPSATALHSEVVRRSHSRELAEALTATGVSRVATHASPSLSERNRAIVEAELGPAAAWSIAAFLAAVEERRRRREAISAELDRLYRRYSR